MVKTEIVSFRTGRKERAQLGALARRAFKKARPEINTKKRDQVSLFMGRIAHGLLNGKIRFNPNLILQK